MMDAHDLGTAEPALAVNEALVIRIQTLFRCRRARREGVELANRAYLKCWDAATGFAYYCNLRTGLSSWKKPLLLAARDAEEVSTATLSNQQQSAHLSEVPPPPPTTDPLSILTTKEWQERHDESVAFQRKCAAEKRDLLLKHRRKVARAMRRFEKNALDEKRQARVGRLARLKNENQTLLQDLHDGKKKENVETIREAAMRGHVDRIETLLVAGFSADAESAMGLTPLLAACQSGHLDVVTLLLASGADVNRAHSKTGRTALMEAASRATPPVLKELLRYGARIHVEDAQGETVFDCMNDVANREIVTQACQVWSSTNAAVFPAEFRQVSLALALVSKRQLNAFIAEKTTTRRELILTKQTLQRQCAEAKVRYDQELRGCKLEATLMRRLAAIEAADSRYEAERRRLLHKLQDAVDKLHNSDRPPFLPERAILNILAFCERHWFEVDRRQARPARARKAANKTHARPDLERWKMSAVVPCTLRAAPDRLPIDLELEWNALHEDLKRLCAQLQTVESNEHFDMKSGVSRDASGLSLATLDVCIEQAENLPYRDPRIGDTIDPFVRVSLRSTSTIDDNATASINSDMRIGDRNPVWAFRCEIVAVPSIQRDLGVQVVDKQRQEVAGEISIPLRSLLDQKEHEEWHVLPPTLRQQLLEKQPRQQPARLRVCVKLTHTKSIVLTRELQQLMKAREALVKRRREFIQVVLQAQFLQLP